MFETNFSVHNTIWGELSPNSPPPVAAGLNYSQRQITS